MKRPILYPYFEKTTNLLLADYRRSKEQAASANVGFNRELFCREFLQRVLPPKLSVRHGEIWDSQGNRTGQLEIIILRDDAASLEFGGADVYLAEGVFAVIEVKSKLTRDKLQEAVTALKRVRNLTPGGPSGFILGPTLRRPLACVVAYEGASWDTLLKEELGGVPDLICILNRGILIAAGHLLRWDDGKPYRWANSRAAALGLLYFHLVKYSASFLSLGLALEPYFEPFDEWGDSQDTRQ
jgi:hypothetical protein